MALLLSIMNILIAQITLVYNYCLFSVGKTVMNKLVYLFELDSVRKSKKEIIKAQKALYEEIVLNGNIVVMTMNQLSDSLGFLIAVNNNETTRHILALFQTGVLRVSSFKQKNGTIIRTPSQYLQIHIDRYLSGAERGFYFSGWFIKGKDRDLIEAIKSALQYNNPGIIDEFRNKSINSFTSSDGETKGKALEDIETFVRMILQMSGDTLSINPAKVFNNSKSMMQFLDLFEEKWNLKKADGCTLSFSAETVDNAFQIIKEHKKEVKNINNRSDWYMIIRKKEDQLKSRQMAEAIIDLCYNYACEDSISGISRHYTDANSFYEDFLNRLHLYWNDGKTGTHKFLADEGNSYSINYVPQKWDHISDIMLYTHSPQERGVIEDNSSDRKTGGLDYLRHRNTEYSKTPVSEEVYEKNRIHESTVWSLRNITAIFRIVVIIIAYIVLFGIINRLLTIPSEIFGIDEKGNIIIIISCIITGLISSIISEISKIPDILDLFKQFGFMLCFAIAVLFKKVCRHFKGGSSYCRICNKQEVNQ